MLCTIIFIILNTSCGLNKFSKTKENFTFKEKAIIEFSKSNFFKEGRVYQIDSLSLKDNIVYIGIIEYNYKVLASESEIKKIPDCMEFKNSLFILNWKLNDSDVQKAIILLKKYEVLMDDTDENYFSFNVEIDENLKSFKMFFCKDNINIHKVSKTSYPIQIFNIPRLKCN